jgi:methionyl-tRNA synthetase
MLKRRFYCPKVIILGKPDYLFERIEDAAIEAQIQKLLDTKKVKRDRLQDRLYSLRKEPFHMKISLKLDIRTATIIAAEAHSKSEKTSQAY